MKTKQRLTDKVRKMAREMKVTEPGGFNHFIVHAFSIVIEYV